MATTDERLETAAAHLEEARVALDGCEEESNMVDRLTAIHGATMAVAHAGWHLAEVRSDTALVRSMRSLCDTMVTACVGHWREAMESL